MYEDFLKEEADGDATGTEHVLPTDFGRCYPNVAFALCGKCGSKAAKIKPLPPASISIRAGNAGIVFTVTPQKADRVVTGFIADPGPLLDQIEEALASGAYTKAPAYKR